MFEEIIDQFRNDLISGNVRRVRVNPYYYQRLAHIVDEIDPNVQVIEDLSVDLYNIE